MTRAGSVNVQARSLRRWGMAALAALVTAPVPAQTTMPSRAAMLLTLPASARGLALGEAWGTVANDESALFYNPAQLARVTQPAAGLSVQRYVASTTLAAAALAWPVAGGTAGVGMQLLDYGREDEFVPDPASGGQSGVATGGSVTAQDIALTAGYGATVGSERRLRIGGAVKFARQHVAFYAGHALAADVGAAYTLGAGWDLSGALQHMGSHLRLAAVSSPLPWTWRAGLAAPAMRVSRLMLRPMAEVRQVSGAPATGVLAVEGTWRTRSGGPVLAGRAAYAIRGSGEDRSPLTLGGGIVLGPLAVDYAYEGFDLLGGATHRVGVRLASRARSR